MMQNPRSAGLQPTGGPYNALNPYAMPQQQGMQPSTLMGRPQPGMLGMGQMMPPMGRGMPQLSPQNRAMLARLLAGPRGAGGGQPGMPPQGASRPPMGGPQSPRQPVPSRGAPLQPQVRSGAGRQFNPYAR